MSPEETICSDALIVFCRPCTLVFVLILKVYAISVILMSQRYIWGARLKNEIWKILSHQKGRSAHYDCVVAVRGGRDSSYIFWYIIKKLGIRAIAYSADNCYVPEVAKRNMERISDELGADLVIEQNTFMKKCLKHHLNAFMHRPSPAMIGVICAGCELGIKRSLLEKSVNKYNRLESLKKS